jgi:hypothetical protein
MLLGLRTTLEFLAGESDLMPSFLARVPAWVYRSLVWILSLTLIYIFCGQTTRFIYIDF